MTTWNTVNKPTVDWDDATHYLVALYNVDKAYNTVEYNYNGEYEKEIDYFTVSKNTTTWS